MQVRLVAVAGVDRGDELVGGVDDLVAPEADAEAGGHLTLPPDEHRLALVVLDLEVGGGLPLWEGMEPYEPPHRVEDHRAGLAVAVW